MQTGGVIPAKRCCSMSLIDVKRCSRGLRRRRWCLAAIFTVEILIGDHAVQLVDIEHHRDGAVLVVDDPGDAQIERRTARTIRIFLAVDARRGVVSVTHTCATWQNTITGKYHDKHIVCLMSEWLINAVDSQTVFVKPSVPGFDPRGR